ncbi:putative metal ion transporter C27B12.12c [Sclerotinia borealis F-4128]|uniref:Putative metal ion transporter C27B12.12c n=1 Tax=Sclerotinia borealis (strain F-4128) TaxID=1432307 RepID=W9C8V9_SCLBF|nr:putative metal ion transporter C27B12.12c [Sclerotinia borealis F-4128]
MSEHEDTSLDTGYSTPVPELDDHRYQSQPLPKARSRSGTIDTLYAPSPRAPMSPDLARVNNTLLHTIARDFEEAIVDEDSRGVSPMVVRIADRSRRGTAGTAGIRDTSPPSSVKAFADARRREREMSISDPTSVKAFADARRHEEHNPLHRSDSRASHRSHHTFRSRRYTNDDETKSFAGSSKSAEEDVCFPLHSSPTKASLQINFDTLEDFIEDEESRAKTPVNHTLPRVFNDLRTNGAVPTIVTSEGNVVDIPSGSPSSINEKLDLSSLEEITRPQQPHLDANRFEYFSSYGVDTIHAAEFGDLILEGEDIRNLFTLPRAQQGDGVWWLNMNSPTENEIGVICKAFGVHPLTIEDIKAREMREKIELFPSYYFACFRTFRVVEIEDGQAYEPFNIYVIVFREGLLSFSFSPNPHAAQIRKRITTLKDYLALNSDWICYALIDDIVDSFAPVIHRIDNETDTIEDQVFIARTDDMHAFLRKIGMVRKNVMGLMKLLGGKADVLKGFTKRCNSNYSVTPHMDIGLYLGDVQDHVVTMMTSLGHSEKMLSRSHSNYLAQLSIDNITQGNNANKVLSKITLLASILVPLNLVCAYNKSPIIIIKKESGNRSMDSSSSQQQTPDLSKLSDRDKQELQQFIVNETQKTQIQQAVHSLTDVCWKKCITGNIRSGKLDKGEESCAMNCVDRFLDSSQVVLTHLNTLRAKGGA